MPLSDIFKNAGGKESEKPLMPAVSDIIKQIPK